MILCIGTCCVCDKDVNGYSWRRLNLNTSDALAGNPFTVDCHLKRVPMPSIAVEFYLFNFVFRNDGKSTWKY